MYIPAHLNSDYLTEIDIKNFYSLEPVDEYDFGHKKRMSKHIDEFITFQNGGTFTSKESQKQKKKRLSASVKSRPKNSKVFIAFNFWRKDQINKHIIKQIKTDTSESEVSDDKKRIQELENLLKDKDTEIRKLNDKIKKMIVKPKTPKAATPKPEATPEPVEEQKKEEEEEENPYDNTSEDEALEIYQQRINIKADYFADITDKDTSLKSDYQLLNQAYEFVSDEIELLFDIHGDLDYQELFKKLEFLKDRIIY